MKLFIQIPCLNEEATLPAVIAALPRTIPGIRSVEYLVIDDGSSDRTSEVARELGVHHVVRFARTRGLARAYTAGIEACLRLGADIIVNTDGDNQYCGADVPALVQPVLEGRADVVVGDRRIAQISEFSPLKKFLQRLGSAVVRRVSNTRVPDATSGFRALSREAALRVTVTSSFTYTIETLIQAGQVGLAVEAVPVRTNPRTRKSRLFRSMREYVRRSVTTIFRIYAMYRPLRAFSFIALGLLIFGVGLGLRFLYFYMGGSGAGHVQSLILAAIATVVAFIVMLGGLLADLIGANRKLLEEAILRLRRLEYQAAQRGANEVELLEGEDVAQGSLVTHTSTQSQPAHVDVGRPAR